MGNRSGPEQERELEAARQLCSQLRPCWHEPRRARRRVVPERPGSYWLRLFPAPLFPALLFPALLVRARPSGARRFGAADPAAFSSAVRTRWLTGLGRLPSCERLGNRPRRAFQPHITGGRVSERKRARALRSAVALSLGSLNTLLKVCFVNETNNRIAKARRQKDSEQGLACNEESVTEE